jgi:hypothetical protein
MRVRDSKNVMPFSLSMLVASLLIGCGGGASSSSSASTYSISGTVPGTLIEAFCKDGSYYKIASDDNGTSNHPFKLELPLNIDCKIVMTTNENDSDITKRIVTPIEFSDGTSTSTYINLQDDIEIGYIGLAMSGQGVQSLLNVHVDGDKVKINTFTIDPLDDDKDGIPNVYEDDDKDGKYNKDDDDDDGDGIKDSEDKDYRDDTDGDGIDNDYDSDDDGDGIEDSKDDDHDGDKNTTPVDTTLPSTYTQNAGRLLSSQCFQCHGTNGVSVNDWDSITGEDILGDEMFDEDPLMDAQADGYTNTEITLMNNWLKTLPSNED